MSSDYKFCGYSNCFRPYYKMRGFMPCCEYHYKNPKKWGEDGYTYTGSVFIRECDVHKERIKELEAENKQLREDLEASQSALGETFNKLADTQQKRKETRIFLDSECKTCVYVRGSGSCGKCYVLDFLEGLGDEVALQQQRCKLGGNLNVVC